MNQENNNLPEQTNLKSVTCSHCGKRLNVRVPTIPGRYKFNCPQCMEKVSFVVPAAPGIERKVLKSDVLDDRVISRRLPRNVKPAMPQGTSAPASIPQGDTPFIPVLGTPEMVHGKDYYKVTNVAQVGRQYRFECPGCHKDIVINPQVAGKTMQVKCSKCATVVRYKTAAEGAETPSPKTPPPLPQQSNDAEQRTVRLGNYGDKRERAGHAELPSPHDFTFKKPHGMLCWKTGSLMKRTKVYNLLPGRNVIGRFDRDMPSDAMISGDDEMSRQSIEINVFQKQGFHDLIYELRILRSTSTIYINGRPVDNKRIVHLSYGDTIRMGKTNISFIKVADNRL